ncbi:MAG: hydantoinase B/oxoprolinase family protein [Pseudomonadota bacterium]
MPIDQITLDILWARLIATTNDQAAALMRSSFTSIVRDAADLAAGVFDRRGRMIAQAVTGTPGHINSMATGMIHVLEKFPVDTLKPGDVIITNDPWFTASQLNDITITTPVFKDDRCIALFANCCHALDIGGRGLSADSRSVFEEGLQIPIMKLIDGGQRVEPIWELIEKNVRTPREVLGDLHCQITGNEHGARQLLQFLDEFGLPDIEELADEIVTRSEAAMRDRIRALPDGAYTYDLTVDGFDDPLTIKAAIIVAGDRLTVDYAGSPDAVPLGVNVTLNYTTAYTNYGVKCALAGDIPNNEGSFLPLTVTAPEGSLLNCKFPAAVGGRHLVGHFLPSAVMGALADALPDAVQAPGFDGLWDTHISGVDKAGRHFSYTWFSAGGAGAMQGKDGMSATAYPSGIAGVPAESIEALSPLVIRQRSLRPDSGGPGQSRGGLGQTMEIEVLTGEDYLFSGLYERTRTPAPGLHGGRAGQTGALTTNDGTDLRPKITTMLSPSAVTTLAMPGGGGYGPPHLRDPNRVLEDVLDGYVTIDGAARNYGVAIDPITRAIDRAATKRLRAAMAEPS